MSKLQKLVYGAATVGMILAPVAVFAQTFTPPVPPVSGGEVTLTTIQTLIQQVARFLIAVALVIAVIYILWGGIMYMTAGADEAKADAAKGRIKNGIIGAAVVLAVGLILSTVANIIDNVSLGF